MIWVRGPWWDTCWLLSGLPLALAFTLVSFWVRPFWIIGLTLLVFQTGHSLSPIALAWAHEDFRAVMMRQSMKYLILPGAILSISTVAGWVVGQYWPDLALNPYTFRVQFPSISHPLYWLAFVYGTWNIYHFGKQNFGVMSIYRQKIGGYPAIQRRVDLVYCCAMAWLAMGVIVIRMAADHFRYWFLGYYHVLSAYAAIAVVGIAFMVWLEWRSGQLCLPRLVLITSDGIALIATMRWPLVGVALLSMNHWLTSIGLASNVHANSNHTSPYRFVASIILVGIALFCALFIRGFSVPTQLASAAIAFRLALGNVHFLYDRWVWKLSDLRVRATIGRDLLKPKDAAACKLPVPLTL